MPFFKPLNFPEKTFRSERSVRSAGNPLAAAGKTGAREVLKIQAGQNQREDIARGKAANSAAAGNGIEPRVAGEVDFSPAPFEGAEGLTGLELQRQIGAEPLPEIEALAEKAEKIKMRIAAGGSQAEGEDMLAVEFRKTMRQIGPSNMELQQENLRNAMSSVIGGRADRPIASGKGIDPSGESVAIKAEQARGQALGIHPQMMEGMTLPTLRNLVSIRQRSELAKKDHLDGISLELKERELTGKRKEDTLVKTHDRLREDANSLLQPVKVRLETILNTLPPGTVPTGDALLQFEQVLARAKFDLRRATENSLDKTSDDGSGASMGSGMNAEERKAAIDFAMDALTPYEDLLTDPNLGMQKTSSRFNDQALGGALAQEYQISPGLRAAMLIKKALGEGPVTEGLITGEVRDFAGGVNYAKQISQSLSKTGESKGGVGGAAAAQQALALTGNGTTQASRVKVMDKAGGGNPTINRGAAIAPLAALYEPTASLEMKRAAYMSVYGPGNFTAAAEIAGTGSSDSAAKQLAYLGSTVTADNLAQVKLYGNQAGFNAVGGTVQYYVTNLNNVARESANNLTIQGLTIDFDRATETFTVPEQNRPDPSDVDLFGGEAPGSDILDNIGLGIRKLGDVFNTGTRVDSADVITASVAQLRTFMDDIGGTPEQADAAVGNYLWGNKLIDKTTAESYGLRFSDPRGVGLKTVADARGALSTDDRDIVAPSAMTLEELLQIDDKPLMLEELKRRQKTAIAETKRLKEETDKLNTEAKTKAKDAGLKHRPPG